jgi:hypothetical protein
MDQIWRILNCEMIWIDSDLSDTDDGRNDKTDTDDNR